jgi:hypothetical protein
LRNLALAAAAALILTSEAAMAETRSYDFEPFDRVEIATGLHAVITHGDTQAVRVETTRGGVLDKLDITVSRGELRARRDNGNLLDIILGGGLLNMLDFGRDATLYITLPKVTGVQAASGASVSVDKVTSELVDVSASSGGRVEVETAEANALKLSVSSGGTVSLAGSCATLDLSFSSGGRISAPELDCVDLHVSGSRGGSAEVSASGDVTGGLSSGASLTMRGNPQSLDVKSSSGGNVSIH